MAGFAPWLPQDTTTLALYGAYEDEPQTLGAPRPAYGHSKDGRDDLKQVLLSLGVSGDGGIPYGQNIQTHCFITGYACTVCTLRLEFHRALAHTAHQCMTSRQGERDMDWKKLLGSITESVDEELRLRNAYLVAENRMLRQRLSGCVQLRDSDRRVLAEIGKK